MTVPEHVRDFVRDIFPKRQRQQPRSRNPFRDAFEQSLANRSETIKTERQIRRDEGRKLRGGL